MHRYFFIREHGRYVRIDFGEIIYIQGCGNYLKIVTAKKSYMMLIAMKRFEQLLPVHQFIRIHKSYIVSLDFITEFDRATVYLREKKLPVGSQFKGVVERSVVIVQHEHSDDVIPINYVERRVHAG